METVTAKMREILQGGQNLVDCGEYRIDRKQTGFIQNVMSGEIFQVAESQDKVVVLVYKNFEDFLQGMFLTK